MKKFLALLLAVVMMLSLAACGGEASNDTRLIYGSTTEVSGDIGPGAWWTNNATDKMIRDLINDYSPITYNQGGELIVNPTISGGVESVANEDGTKTFTVKINEGLVFSNGEPITAANYVAYGLIGYSAAAAEAGAKLTADMIVGATEYQKGETAELSGLHLIDEYTYSITIASDYVPYFYELSYASLTPLYIPMYASAPLTVVEGETGAKFEGGELVAAEIDAARWMYADAVSAGPYVLKSVDTGALEAVLEINPNYAGNFEGVKPQIQQLVIVKSDTATQFDALATGAIDVLDSLSETAQKVLANLVTIFLGITIACQMEASKFLNFNTLLILGLGLFAFIFDTAGGVIFAKILNLFLKTKINPMIGAAGISAFPMSGRIVHKLGLQEDPQNHLLMQSIGVNVSGQIASVIAGGVILNMFQ